MVSHYPLPRQHKEPWRSKPRLLNTQTNQLKTYRLSLPLSQLRREVLIKRKKSKAPNNSVSKTNNPTLKLLNLHPNKMNSQLSLPRSLKPRKKKTPRHWGKSRLSSRTHLLGRKPKNPKSWRTIKSWPRSLLNCIWRWTHYINKSNPRKTSRYK